MDDLDLELARIHPQVVANHLHELAPDLGVVSGKRLDEIAAGDEPDQPASSSTTGRRLTPSASMTDAASARVARLDRERRRRHRLGDGCRIEAIVDGWALEEAAKRRVAWPVIDLLGDHVGLGEDADDTPGLSITGSPEMR